MRKLGSINKNLLIIILITLAGLLLRLWNLDKSGGMWFDEINTYIEAKLDIANLLKLFFTRHIHAPLYYVILHFWMKIFGDLDLVIRLLSVIFGVLTIPVVYLCGKELKCSKTAAIAALFTAINSLLIYYSQEVRMYSLIALLSASIVLFLLRFNNNPSKLNTLGLVLTNAGLLYTHSIAFVFVFFEFLVFGIYFALKKREHLKPLIYSGILVFIFYAPYLYNLFRMTTHTPGTGITSQWWSKFSFTSVLFSLGDIFSPMLLGNINPPDKYIISIWVIVPLAIAAYGIILAVRKNSASKLLLLACLGFLAVFTVASMKGKVVFLSRYLIELAPILLLLSAYGLVNLKNKILSNILITLFIGMNLIYLFLSPTSAPKTERLEGLRLPAAILEKYEITEKDYIISVGVYKKFFDKYLKNEHFENFYYLDNWNSHFLTSFLHGLLSFKDISDIGYYSHVKRLGIESPEQLKIKRSRHNKSLGGYDTIITYHTNIFDNNSYREEVILNIQGDKKLIIIAHRGLANIKDEFLINKIKNNYEKIQGNFPTMFLLHSRTSHDLVELAEKELSLEQKESKGLWDVYIFKAKQ